MSHHSVFTKQLHAVVIEEAVVQLVKEKLAGVGGRAERESYNEKMASLTLMGAVISRDTLWRRVKRRLERSITEPPVVDVVVNSADSQVASVLTDPSTDSSSSNAASDALKPKAGRPKGSTVDNMRKKTANYRACVDSIALSYSMQLTLAKAGKTRCKPGFLDNLIKERKAQFHISEDIATSSIRKRALRHSTMAANVQSPLAGVELVLVQMCIQMGEIGQPLSVCEAVWAMNGLIEGTMHEEALRAYQDLHKLGTELTRGSCSRNWWRGFLRRHADKIVT